MKFFKVVRRLEQKCRCYTYIHLNDLDSVCFDFGLLTVVAVVCWFKTVVELFSLKKNFATSLSGPFVCSENFNTHTIAYRVLSNPVQSSSSTSASMQIKCAFNSQIVTITWSMLKTARRNSFATWERWENKTPQQQNSIF